MQNRTPVYLKPNIRIEPLFNQWRAWTHLIPPSTAAMNMLAKQIPLMESYLKEFHDPEDYAINSSLISKRAINYGVNKVDEIEALLDKTLKEQAKLVELAQAIRQFSRVLLSQARGCSLEPLYQKLPMALRGFVELVYNFNNQPSIRFIESLIYTNYYKSSSQSVVLSLIDNDKCPLNVRTPRLKSFDCIHLDLNFSHQGIDSLITSRRRPKTFNELKNAIQLDSKYERKFQLFVTKSPPLVSVKYDGKEIRIRFFGHACLLIESRDITILVDPLISYKYHSQIERYSYLDLPEFIDYVLITHGHQDHFDLESLIQLRYKIGKVVVPKNGSGLLGDPSLKLILKNIGFENIIEIDEMGDLPIKDGTITAIPFLGEHSDLNIRAKTAYFISLKGRSILCLADSCNIDPFLYQHVHQLVGNVDALFLGMECEGSSLSLANGPLIMSSIDREMDESRRTKASNYRQGIEIVKQFNCKRVYIYAMGLEPWLHHLFGVVDTSKSRSIAECNSLVTECKLRGIEADRLFGKQDIFL